MARPGAWVGRTAGATDRDGFVRKTLVLDALRIADPRGVSTGGGYGTGDPFAFPVQSFETIVPLGRDRLLLANDNNYPGNAARVPGTPDATEMVVVDLRGARLARPDDTLVVGFNAEAYEQVLGD